MNQINFIFVTMIKKLHQKRKHIALVAADFHIKIPSLIRRSIEAALNIT
jgi:hypothetical protein